MILFLDAVSSLPEFSVIEDNNIIYSSKILSDKNDKMSDLLISSYLSLEKKFDLDSNLKLLIINTGPGSYTALRIGIAFFSGLSLSQNIKLAGISCMDIFRLSIKNEKLINSAIYISSSNNQNFIGIFDYKKNLFNIKKIEKNLNLDKQNINLLSVNKIYVNQILTNEQKKTLNKIDTKLIKFSNIIKDNIKHIKILKKNDILKPIYFSNNQILN